VTVQLSVQASWQTVAAENIIGRSPGSGNPKVIVGAHYDSVEVGPGAHDNASGVGVMLEMARLLAGKTREVAFVAFGAEELGLHGSIHYVNAASPAELAALKAMVNLDMVGEGEQLQIGAGSAAGQGLERMALDLAARIGVPAASFDARTGDSDHAPFANAGVPTVFFYFGLDPYYHTPKDTPDKVDPAKMEATGLVATELVLRVLAGS
jgi:Zn-dependent M28 family amino/carboxypeptidase